MMSKSAGPGRRIELPDHATRGNILIFLAGKGRKRSEIQAFLKERDIKHPKSTINHMKVICKDFRVEIENKDPEQSETYFLFHDLFNLSKIFFLLDEPKRLEFLRTPFISRTINYGMFRDLTRDILTAEIANAFANRIKIGSLAEHDKIYSWQSTPEGQIGYPGVKDIDPVHDQFRVFFETRKSLMEIINPEITDKDVCLDLAKTETGIQFGPRGSANSLKSSEAFCDLFFYPQEMDEIKLLVQTSPTALGLLLSLTQDKGAKVRNLFFIEAHDQLEMINNLTTQIMIGNMDQKEIERLDQEIFESISVHASKVQPPSLLLQVLRGLYVQDYVKEDVVSTSWADACSAEKNIE